VWTFCRTWAVLKRRRTDLAGSAYTAGESASHPRPRFAERSLNLGPYRAIFEFRLRTAHCPEDYEQPRNYIPPFVNQCTLCSALSAFENVTEFVQCIDVKPKKVRLFIKPYCGWCHKASNWLDQRGIDYEEVDVIADESAYDEMIRLSGQELAPVIDVDGEILADFGPDQLAEFWQQLEKKNGRLESR
jgi:glutaredoxin